MRSCKNQYRYERSVEKVRIEPLPVSYLSYILFIIYFYLFIYLLFILFIYFYIYLFLICNNFTNTCTIHLFIMYTRLHVSASPGHHQGVTDYLVICDALMMASVHNKEVNCACVGEIITNHKRKCTEYHT
jgi:hypothetical protein